MMMNDDIDDDGISCAYSLSVRLRHINIQFIILLQMCSPTKHKHSTRRDIFEN